MRRGPRGAAGGAAPERPSPWLSRGRAGEGPGPRGPVSRVRRLHLRLASLSLSKSRRLGHLTVLTAFSVFGSQSQHQPAFSETEDHLQGLHQQGTPGAGLPAVTRCRRCAQLPLKPRIL